MDVATFSKLIGMKESEVEKRIKARTFKVYYTKGKTLKGRQAFKNTAIMKREARAIVHKLQKDGNIPEAKAKKILAQLQDVAYERGAKAEKVAPKKDVKKVAQKVKARKPKNVATVPPIPQKMSGESK